MTSGNSPNCVGLDANLEDNVREYANLNKPFLDSIGRTRCIATYYRN